MGSAGKVKKWEKRRSKVSKETVIRKRTAQAGWREQEREGVGTNKRKGGKSIMSGEKKERKESVMRKKEGFVERDNEMEQDEGRGR